MTIHPIRYVREVYAQALASAPDRESAIRATAQHLALPVEAVRSVVSQETTS